VLVFVPGIKGSFLRRPGGRRVWVEARDLVRRGGETLDGPLEPDGVIDAIPLLPCFASTVYGSFLEWAAEGALLLPFAYDWRRDARDVSRDLARRLASLAEGKKSLVVVGHSFGGLIALHVAWRRTTPCIERLVLADA